MQDERNADVLGGGKQVPKTPLNAMLQAVFTICPETQKNKGKTKHSGQKGCRARKPYEKRRLRETRKPY